MGCVFPSRNDEENQQKGMNNPKTEIRKQSSFDCKEKVIEANTQLQIHRENIVPEKRLPAEKHDKAKEVKIFKGIQNLGNTCFMNSIFQSLAHTKEFMKILRNDNQISQALNSVLVSLYTEDNTSQRVQIFINEISKLNPIWRDKKPHDCKEFLVFLFNSLPDHQTNIFSWIFEKKLVIGCGMHNETLKEKKIFFTIYSLRPEAITNSIDQKIKPNKYHGYFCTKCNTEFSCKETWEVIKKPQIFIFYIEPNKSKPTNLREIEDIMYGGCLLTLYAAVISIEMNIRHFIAICKENSGWIIYNDDRVLPYKAKSIEGLYMLFYKSS
jgi:ubiquitin C-terminal hydrolase